MTITQTLRWAHNTADLAASIEHGLNKIDAMTKGADKLAKSLQNDAVNAANKWATAIGNVSNVTTLTTREKARMNAALREGIEKYGALGRTAPSIMLELEQATRRTETSTGKGGLLGKVELLQKAFIGMQIGRFAMQTIESAGRLTDLSAATGLTVRELGRLKAAGSLVGVSIDQIATGAFKMQKELGEDTGAAAAIRGMGLSLDNLRKMTPGAMLEAIAAAAGAIEDPVKRADTVSRIFAKNGMVLMPLLRLDIKKVGDEAERTGQVMDEKMVASLDQAGDRIDKFKNQVMVLVGKPLSILSWLVDKGSTAFTNFAMGADLAWSSLKRLYLFVAGAPKMPKLPETPASALPAKLAAPVTPSTDALIEDMKRQAAAARGAAKAADQAEAAYQAWRSQMTGAALQADVAQLTARLARLTREGCLNAIALQNIGKEARELREKGAALSPALQDIIARTLSWADGMPKVEVGLESITRKMPDLRDELGKTASAIAGVEKGITSIVSVGGIGQILKDLPGMKVDLAAPKNPLTSFKDFFKQDLSKTILSAFQGGGSALKSIGGAVGGFLSSGSSVVGKALGSGLSSLLGKGLGSALGSFLPGVGTMLGGLVGSKLGGLFGGLFGGKDKKATDDIRKMQAELLKTHGSLDDIRRMGQLVGVNLADAWGAKGQAGLRSFTALAEEFQKKQERLQGALERYGLTWMDLGDQARKAQLGKVADELIADFEILKTAGMDVTKITTGMSSAINKYLTDALTTGAAIPPAMQPMIEQLIRTGQLTEQNAALLLGMKHEAVPAWADVKAAAERYGIELDALGPKIQQIRITEEANQIVKDWEFLIGAGADAGAVMAGMADDVQKLIDAALKSGLQLPASMKPMLEQMVQAGLLTDETGGKLTDLSRLNFAQPLTEMVETLISKLNELIDSIRGGDGLEGAIRSVDGRVFTVTGRVKWEGAPGAGGPGGGTAHSGAYVGLTGLQKHHQGAARILKFHHGVANLASDEVPAILQVGESVLNRRATEMIGPDAIRAINQGRAAAPGPARVEVRTAMLEQQIVGLRQDMRDTADKTYRAIRDAIAQGAA